MKQLNKEGVKTQISQAFSLTVFFFQKLQIRQLHLV